MTGRKKSPPKTRACAHCGREGKPGPIVYHEKYACEKRPKEAREVPPAPPAGKSRGLRVSFERVELQPLPRFAPPGQRVEVTA
ncbi:MAG TPA: hypothetical protein VNZ52_16960 [Candidatus Thermoplasmatota archaeon]|nr:hypothetical protein [Candidatus Thermoplasmatota archaeon]